MLVRWVTCNVGEMGYHLPAMLVRWVTCNVDKYLAGHVLHAGCQVLIMNVLTEEIDYLSQLLQGQLLTHLMSVDC